MLINLKNANICQREGRLVLGNVNLPYWGMTC